ncbi:hypothetical protein [Mesorhizobium sp. SP-1A]|uniref:hypothetical protein n=1 Tax=Mesorhizobium sp. SP-1A TaxID=3077840 RepID=UPI0028F716C2|nr:hypothetical protein [Mesorhizobium sp. SP-1A]
MAKDVINFGEVSAGLICPDCGSTDFQNEGEGDSAIVSCKSCGHKFGTLAEVNKRRLAAAKKKAGEIAKDAKASILKSIRKSTRRR